MGGDLIKYNFSLLSAANFVIFRFDVVFLCVKINTAANFVIFRFDVVFLCVNINI